METARTEPGGESNNTSRGRHGSSGHPVHRRPALPVAWRLPVLATGGFALLAGLYAALLLLGVRVPGLRPDLPKVHGPVMVLGFVGTLVALERAVALGTRWSLLAPACAGLGAIVLVVTGPSIVGKVLLAIAGAALLAVYGVLWRRQQTVALLSQAAAAVAWYSAATLWLAGFSVAETVPWLAAFIVATIAGERLELAHLGLGGPAAERMFLALLGGLIAAATATALWPGPGHHLLGIVLLLTVAWLLRFDVARRTVRATGLPRFAAVGLLSGYAWLALAGVLWAGAGETLGGARYDATLHSVFLGFAMSMIFVHAPVILPAVLRRPLPYHPALYGPLALLHLSLFARIVLGDAFGRTVVWRWSGVINVIAVLGFFILAALLVVRARRAPARPVSRAADRPAVSQAAPPAAQPAPSPKVSS